MNVLNTPKPGGSIEVTNTESVYVSPNPKKYGIAPRDWFRIRRNISKISQTTEYNKIFITLFASMCVSFIVTAITTNYNMGWSNLVLGFILISLFSFIGLLCSCLVYNSIKRNDIQTVQCILEDMDEIWSEFPYAKQKEQTTSDGRIIHKTPKIIHKKNE